MTLEKVIGWKGILMRTVAISAACWLAFVGNAIAWQPEPRLQALLADLASDDVQVRAKAALDLSKIKPLDEAVIPALLKALDDRTPNAAVHIYAAWALDNAGPQAAEAVKSRLREKLRATNVTSPDMNEVHSLRGASLPALTELLADRDQRMRARSLTILENMGPTVKSAAPVVAAALQDPTIEVRLAAARCLFTLTGDTKQTVPVLIEGLKEPAGRSAHWCDAAQTLGEIGPPATSAVPLLIEMLEGKREIVGGSRTVYIGPPTPWFHVRWQAARALGQIGPSAKAAVPALVKATTQADDGIKTAGPLRVRAARALWLIDPRHPQAVSAVVRGLSEKYPMNRIAIDTIIMVGPPAESAVPALIKALDADHRDVQLAAIDALGIIGAPAESALPVLRAVTADKHPFAREHAQLAIARIGPPEQSAAAILAAAQRTATDPELRGFLAER